MVETEETDFEEFNGLVFEDVKHSSIYGDVILFKTATRLFMMSNTEECACTTIEDICGNLDDLIGSPIIRCYSTTNHDNQINGGNRDDSFTWTFYHIYTVKGYVTIRWYGSSNGYYAEDATIDEVYVDINDRFNIQSVKRTYGYDFSVVNF